MAPRRSPIRSLLALAVAAATALAACQGAASPPPTPTPPPLTDAKVILARSFAALAPVKTFHLHADISGRISSALLGSAAGLTGALGSIAPAASTAPGASGQAGALDLTGTTADADFDIGNRDAHLTLAAPTLFGLSVDYIMVGNDSYTKTTFTGPKYVKGVVAASPSTPAESMDPAAALASLGSELDRLSTPPQVLAPEACSAGQCYHVRLAVSSADAANAAASAGTSGPAGALGGLTGNATIDYFAAVDTLRPDHAAIAVDGGDAGTLTVSVGISSYDAPVTIAAPPADQVTAAPAGAGGLGGYIP